MTPEIIPMHIMGLKKTANTSRGRRFYSTTLPWKEKSS
jgi:hypothetical protein